MNELIKKRAEIFLEKDIPIHIVLKDDIWLNGYIIKIYDDYFDFVDRKLGEMPIFFVDVHSMDFFRGDIDSLSRGKNE